MTTITNNTTTLVLYSANLALLLTHLYGWILKWFYRPRAYEEQFHKLFPAQRKVGALYLLQAFEIPYLLQIGDHDALLYVNTFTLLVFSIQMLLMCEGYFFPKVKRKAWHYVVMFLPLVLIVAPLLLQALGIIALPESHRLWVFVVVTIVFLPYLLLTVRMALRIRRAVRQVNEAAYADSDDFPVRFARFIQWVPTIVLLIMAVNFYADDPIVKGVRDVLFTFVNIWFCILTLNPWRKVFTPDEEEIIEQIGTNTFRLNDEKFQELKNALDDLLVKKRVFTEPHITIETITRHIGTNPNYLSEVIRRSGYTSFYDMICQHRVRHAIALINNHPDEKLLLIAERCGFTSSASMAKAFKQQGKQSPSSYRKKKA